LNLLGIDHFDGCGVCRIHASGYTITELSDDIGTRMRYATVRNGVYSVVALLVLAVFEGEDERELVHIHQLDWSNVSDFEVDVPDKVVEGKLSFEDHT
jgi:hypothetical protein